MLERGIARCVAFFVRMVVVNSRAKEEAVPHGILSVCINHLPASAAIIGNKVPSSFAFDTLALGQELGNWRDCLKVRRGYDGKRGEKEGKRDGKSADGVVTG